MAVMDKLRTGIFGLNSIMDGGLNKNSTTVVIGATGAGKTTLALQFVRRGLEEGQEGVFISLDEAQAQIIKEAEAMGWVDIRAQINAGKLVFIDASAKEFTEFVKTELPLLVDEWRGFNARIVVDPLTPVMWTIKDLYEQREYVTLLMNQLRTVGTVICTLEEHGGQGNLSGSEITIPMYVADCVIHLRHNLLGKDPERTLKIIKFRGSGHDESAHPYKIIKSLGIVVNPARTYRRSTKATMDKVKKALKEKMEGLPPEVAKKVARVLEDLGDQDLEGLDLDRFVQNILDEYQ
jgi:KaiC/GvpD/RAD55 family RecA-like ATPase